VVPREAAAVAALKSIAAASMSADDVDGMGWNNFILVWNCEREIELCILLYCNLWNRENIVCIYCRAIGQSYEETHE